MKTLADKIQGPEDPPKVDADKKHIQKILKNKGFYKGKIDGIIGPKTNEAFEMYFKSIGEKPPKKVGDFYEDYYDPYMIADFKNKEKTKKRKVPLAEKI